MNANTEKQLNINDSLPRAAAVIVASRPLEREEAISDPGKDKQILPAMIKAGQVSFIERIIIRFQMAGVAPIVVITGFESETLEKHLARMSVVSLNNLHWRKTSVFDDAVKGLSYIDRTCKDCEKIFLATPLVPSVSTDSLSRLLVAKATVAVPVFEGEDGLPIVIRKDAVRGIARAEKGRTFADLVAVAPGTVERVELDDQGILSSIGDPDLFERAESQHERALKLPMRVRPKLNLAREKVFFGPGPAVLLRLIDETGSVRTACLRMKLSYSKGWQILNLLEEQLGARVIVRKPGGQEGGSSTLTEIGRELLQRYEQLSVESQQSINALFDKIFEGFPAE